MPGMLMSVMLIIGVSPAHFTGTGIKEFEGGASIVNLASMSSFFAVPIVPGSGAAKAGVVQLTKNLAVAWAKHRIRVNTVSPGYVETDMVMAIRKEIRDQIVASIPMGRLAKPEEIAAVVAFLASDEAGYITGANISVNGGMHMM